jgi:hypothetical protein
MTKINLARADGLISGVQGALKHVLVYTAHLEPEQADIIMKKTNEILDEVKTILKEIDNESK